MFRIFMRRWITDRQTRRRDQYAALLAIVGLLCALLTLTFMILSQFPGRFGAVGLGGVILFAAAAAGGGLGFLFSVPRVLSTGEAGPKEAHRKEGEAKEKAVRLLESNTNLERISEWLTTMIVGVGLSQITSVREHMASFTTFLTRHHQSETLAAAGPFILIVGLVGGFIFLYLYTRLYLSPLFLYVETLISKIGQEEVPTQEDRIRSLASDLAEKTNADIFRYIANVDAISLDQTMHVLSALLYEENGYTTVLDIGEDLKDTVAAEMPRFWYIMAAANGQRHHQLQQVEGAEAERDEAYGAVLKASQRAVKLDPNYKRHLLELTYPDARDNDLQDFRDDANFRRIIR